MLPIQHVHSSQELPFWASRTAAVIVLVHVFAAVLLCQVPDAHTSADRNRGEPTYSAPQSFPSASVNQQQLPEAPQPQTGSIIGTVTDVNNAVIPGATVAIKGPAPSDHRTVATNDKGFFEFSVLEPGTYHVTIIAKGFANWISPTITLNPGQAIILTGSKLKVAEAKITVIVSSAQIATEQVKIQEKQRVFGILPNFYVTYEPHAEPLTTKLKFKLALRTLIDPINILGVGMYAGVEQAVNRPDYGQGAEGYGKRFGAIAADGSIDIMIGGAILPSLLHQDPRYFYKGTGTKKSRILHAVSSPFICKGDNGHLQPNYSSMGGDLATAAISNAYYPESNRGAGLVFTNFLIGTSERVGASLAQEFLLRKLTPNAKKQK